MSKRGKESGGEVEETTEAKVNAEGRHERTAQMRSHIDTALLQLRPQLVAGGGTEGRMIEPTLGTIHLQETLELARELCDEYDAAEGREETVVLAEKLNALNNYITKLWDVRAQELREMQRRMVSGEKVRTDGTLVVPPNWDRLPKHKLH